MKIIDSHIHLGAVKRIPELVSLLDSEGISQAGLISLPGIRSGNFNPALLYAKSLYPQCFYINGSFEYGKSAPSPAEQLKLLKACGFDGLKLWEGKPLVQRKLGITLRDKRLREALKVSEDLNFPALIHAADPIDFWNERGSIKLKTYKGGGYPPFKDYICQAYEIARDFPRLRIVFAHMLFLAQDLAELARFLEENPSVSLDLSPGRYFYPALSSHPDEARSFFRTFKARLLFGTDCFFFSRSYLILPYENQARAGAKLNFLRSFLETEETLPNPYPFSAEKIPNIKGLSLERDILEHLYHKNFHSLYGLNPIKLNTPLVSEYLRAFGKRNPLSGAPKILIDPDTGKALSGGTEENY